MLKRIEQVSSFQVYNDQGESDALHVVVEVFSMPHGGHPTAERRSLPHVMTSKGEHVNCLERGKRYVVPSTGEIFHSDDPDAY